MADLRAAVYRKGATAQDVEALEAALRAGRPEAQISAVEGVEAVEATVRRRQRWLLYPLGVAVVAAVSLLISLSLQPTTIAPIPGPESTGPSSVALPYRGSADQRRAQRAELRELFDARPTPSLRSYLLANGLAGLGRLRPDVHTVVGSATGTASFDLGALNNGAATGQLTLLFSCDRPAAYSWTFSSDGPAHDDPTSLTRSGPECFGQVIASTFVPRPGHVPQKLTLAVPSGTRILVDVELARE